MKNLNGRVKSGVPQGSVLTPIMFLVYVNDMTERISTYLSLFADDAKLLMEIKKPEGLWGATEWHKQDI